MGHAQAQAAPEQPAWIADHSPRGALWRAAALPGWGQVYNRQYVKLPFVYAALGGITYLIIDLNRDYTRYREAFLYRAWEDEVAAGAVETNPFAEFQPTYDGLTAEFDFELGASALQQRRDILRRNRDFSLIGGGLVYGLTILDAYISAHLLDFDVGEDLTAALRPSPQGWTMTLRLDL